MNSGVPFYGNLEGAFTPETAGATVDSVGFTGENNISIGLNSEISIFFDLNETAFTSSGQTLFEFLSTASVGDTEFYSVSGTEVGNSVGTGFFFEVNSNASILSIEVLEEFQSPAPVPLPATGLLTLFGLASLGGLRWARRKT